MTGAGYHEISEILRREILNGKYDQPKTLPSEFSLARRFKVCRPTVSRAMMELSHAGLVVRRKGAPTVLSRFARNASGCMGLIIQGRLNAVDVYPRVGRRLVELAERSGWKVLTCAITATAKRARIQELREIIERFREEHVTGVFFQPVECMVGADRFNIDLVSRIERAGMRITLLDYDIVRLPGRSAYDLVGMDNFAAGYAMGVHLVDRGVCRAVFLKMPYAAPSVEDRLRGIICAFQEKLGTQDLRRNLTVCDPSDAAKVYGIVKRFRADAVVAYNDACALSVCAGVRKIGVCLEQVAKVVGFDDISSSEAELLPLTTMRQDADSIAETAFHTLVSRIKSPRLPPRRILLPFKLVER